VFSYSTTKSCQNAGMNDLLVVKYGGNAMKSPELRRAVAAEIAALRASRPVVVVHGGGPVIEASLSRLGIESRFLRGLRVTSPDAMDVIEAAITKLSKELSQEIGGAIGLTGRDAALLEAHVLEAELGRVGRVERVNVNLINTLLESNITPVIGCIAVESGTGDALNINADWAAGSVAGALGSSLVFLTDVPGVMRDPKDPSTLAPSLTKSETLEWINQGIISGGMIPKVEAALHALDRGAQSATIASGMLAGVLGQAAKAQAGTTLRP
jgi:acetylglutamate kinase